MTLGSKSKPYPHSSGQLATTQLLPLLCANMLPPGETAVMLLKKRSGEDITHLVFSAKLDYSVTGQTAHHSKYSACDSWIHCSALLVTHSLCLIHRKSGIQCREVRQWSIVKWSRAGGAKQTSHHQPLTSTKSFDQHLTWNRVHHYFAYL